MFCRIIFDRCDCIIFLSIPIVFEKYCKNILVRDEGMVMFATIFSVLFAFVVISALVAKFHFGHNLTSICFYQYVFLRKIKIFAIAYMSIWIIINFNIK